MVEAASVRRKGVSFEVKQGAFVGAARKGVCVQAAVDRGRARRKIIEECRVMEAALGSKGARRYMYFKSYVPYVCMSTFSLPRTQMPGRQNLSIELVQVQSRVRCGGPMLLGSFYWRLARRVLCT